MRDATVQANPNHSRGSPRSSVARGPWAGSRPAPAPSHDHYHLVQATPWQINRSLELQHANHIDFHVNSKIAKEHRPPTTTLPCDDASRRALILPERHLALVVRSQSTDVASQLSQSDDRQRKDLKNSPYAPLSVPERCLLECYLISEAGLVSKPQILGRRRASTAAVLMT